MNKKVKIGLADDHKLFRKGIAELINGFDAYTVLWEASNGNEVIEYIKDNLVPDILLLDINMPDMNGYETAAWLKKSVASIKVLALSMYDGEAAILKMLKAGAKGYILKDAEPAELLKALDEVSENSFYHSDLVNRILIKSLHAEQTVEPKIIINERETTFLKLACTELTYKEIADQMNLSPRTVDGYREALFERFYVKSRVGLVLFAIKNGIIAVDE